MGCAASCGKSSAGTALQQVERAAKEAEAPTTTEAEAAAIAAHNEALSESENDAACWLCLEVTNQDLSGPNAKLLRGCACRGSAGFAHIECLVGLTEADSARWWSCPTCKQEWWGEVRLRLAKTRWHRVKDRPPQDTQRLVAADDLAGALQEMGDDAAALPLFSEALEVERQVHASMLGTNPVPPHPSLLVSISNLAVCQTNLGNCADALPLAEEALAGWREVRGEDHEHTLTALSLVSQVQRGLKDFKTAVPLAETTLASQRETLGDEHPDTCDFSDHFSVTFGHLLGIIIFGETCRLHGISAMAALYSELGNYGAAEPLYAEALKHQRTTLGNDHPDTLLCMRSLGQTRCSAGDREAGVALLQEASRGYDKVLGKDHPDTIAAAERLKDAENTNDVDNDVARDTELTGAGDQTLAIGTLIP